MGEKNTAGYYAVIPAAVRYNEELPANAKLLYGELTALCGRDGYCWASNEYFAELYHVASVTVSRWVSALEKLGCIRTEMVATERGSERRIYAGLFVVTEGGLNKNDKTPLNKNDKRGLNKNDKTPKGNILNINNNTVNIPPIVPQGGQARDAVQNGRDAGRGCKATAEWKTERFEGFWRYYKTITSHAKVNSGRQATIRAWDKLKPSDELIIRMGQALKRFSATEEWKRGVGIPHASTWLNQHRWEDAEDPPEPEAVDGDASGFHWAPDPEVMC